MRRPLRKAALWFGLAGLGALLLAAAVLLSRNGSADVPVLIAGVPGIAFVLFGVVYGLLALLAAHGEARLRRGVGQLARWQVPPAEWEAFRRFDAARGATDTRLRNDFTPRPADGPVEVLFGRRQVMVDGSYHPLRRFAVPELAWVGWQQPEGAPECLEFGILYPRGRYGGTLAMVVRIPVTPAAREDAVRVFHHFKALAPKPRVGLAFRRPWLVIGWGLGVTAAALLAAAIGWLLEQEGSRDLLPMLLQLGGLIAAIGGALFTALILLATMPWKKEG